tara:strand:- start:339 stop:1268 length:930 start_codon:yes stop_codon:yes gene_type:complete
MAFYKAGHALCRRELSDITRDNKDYTLVRRMSSDYEQFLQFCNTQPDLVDYFESRKESRESRSKESNDDPWSGTKTYDDCKELAERGWADGLEYVEEVRKRMANIISSKIKAYHPRYAEAGDEIDIGAYLDGDPEHWIEFHEVETDGTGGKIVRVLVNVAVSCGVDKDIFIHRGAAVVGLIEQLQQCGYSVEMTLVSTTHTSDSEKIHQYEVPVKRSDEHLDGDRAAFMIIHPSILRRLIFAAKEQEETDDYMGGYGTPCEIVGATDKDFVFDRIHGGDDLEPWKSVESAADAVIEALVKRDLISIEDE